MKSNNCSVLVLSCDAFEDCWDIFFKLKDKYWDCQYKTYLMTETKEYNNCIKTTGAWTKRVREALEQIPTEYVLITLDDFFIRDYVDQKRIESIVFPPDTAVFNFELAYATQVISYFENGFSLRKNGTPYLLSCQPSIWDKEKLISLLQKDQTAWEWELQIIESPYKHFINTTGVIMNIGYFNHKPFSIKQGKWCEEIVPFFESEGIKIDYKKRGFYS